MVRDNDCSWKDYLKVKNAMTEYEAIHREVKPLTGPLNNIWLFGPTGVCKSTALQLIKKATYKKDKTKYWNGYSD